MQWRHEPVTKVFLNYLADKSEDYQDRALALLLSDSLDLPTQHEIKARIWCLNELQALTLDDIRSLYGIAKPEADKAPE